ncbi:MAG: fibronectin type III domain-containing protein, partial [Candidatus Omnitrophica bacterium]|nr:fibronectin type III domain-containing protein [Candidatus Omnitrophota bacterium]
SYSDSGLTPNTKYYYLVFAYIGNSYSEYTNYGIVTTTPIVPAAPKNLTVVPIPATGTTDQVKLDWQSDSTDVDEFLIELSYESATTNYIQIGTALGTARTISWYGRFPDNTTGYYRVRARNSVGLSGYSNVVSIVTHNETDLPLAPTNLTVTVINANNLRLNWTNKTLTPATQILVERGIDGTNFTQVGSVNAVGTTQAYDDINVVPGKKYYYRVRAHNSIGNSPYTAVVNATTPSSIQAPTNLKADVWDYHSVRLIWNDDNNDEQGFEVWRSTTSGSGFTFAQNVPTYNSPVMVADVKDLNPLTTYYFKVRAYNKNGIYSDFSNQVSATTPDTPFPHAPTNLAATSNASNRVNLTWKDNSANELGFNVYRRKGTSGNFYLVTVGALAPKNVTKYTDTSVSGGTLYYYRVTAVNAAGESGYAECSLTTAEGVQAPTNLKADVWDYHSVRLIWNDDNNDEQGFEVWRSTTSGSGFTFAQNVPTYNSPVMVADVKDLNPLTTYYFKVRAYNKNGIYSDFSNQVSATTPDTPFPHAPTNLAATSNASNRVNLTWKDNSANELGFNVYRRKGTSGNFYLVTVGALAPKNVTKYTDTSVSGGTLYYYRVTAVNASGQSGYTEASVTTP